MEQSAKLEVTLAFKGMKSSDAVKEYAEKKAEKLIKGAHHLTRCHYVFFKEKTDMVAQLHMVAGDFEARAEGRGETSMYEAIDEVTDKVIHQARKHNDKEKRHKGAQHHGQDNLKAEDSEEE